TTADRTGPAEEDRLVGDEGRELRDVAGRHGRREGDLAAPDRLDHGGIDRGLGPDLVAGEEERGGEQVGAGHHGSDRSRGSPDYGSSGRPIVRIPSGLSGWRSARRPSARPRREDSAS